MLLSRLSNRGMSYLVGLMLLALAACGAQGTDDAEFVSTHQAIMPIPTPIINGVSLQIVPTTGNVIVTITGDNFVQTLGPVIVTFNGNSALAVGYVSTTQIQAYVPSGTAGPINLSVANTGGRAAVSTGLMEYFNDNLDFRLPYSITAGSSILDAAIADIDHDGRQDIVLLTAQNLQVYIGLPNRKFSAKPPVSVAIGSISAGRLAVGNLDGNVYPDIVITHPSGNFVTTWLGTGSGNFSGPRVFSFSASSNPGPIALTLKDMDKNNLDDVLVLSQNSHELAILLTSGSGSLGTAKITAVPGWYYASSYGNLVTGDLNGDTYPDVIASYSYSSAYITIWINDKSGNLLSSPAYSYSAGTYPMALAAADLTGDGNVDIATVDNYNVRILQGRGDGTMSTYLTLSLSSSPLSGSLYLQDIDGDMRTDIVVGTYSSAINYFKGFGGGSFAGPTSVSVGAYAGTMMRLGDLEADSSPPDALLLNTRSNILTTSSSIATVIYNQSGTFASLSTSWGSFSSSVLIGDVDRISSSCPEIVTADYISSYAAESTGNCSGVFKTPTSYASLLSTPDNCAFGDIDRNGTKDVLCGSSGSSISVLLGQITGVFSTTSLATSKPMPSAIVGLDFFPADQWSDFIVAHPSSDGLTVLLNKQTTPFGFTQTFYPLGTGSKPSAVAAADVNHDNYLDVMAISFEAGRASVLLNDKTNQFPMVASFAIKSHPSAFVVSNFNGDSHPDLAVAHYDDDHAVVLYTGNGDGTFNTANVYAAPPGCHASNLAQADWNRDGKPDLALYCDGPPQQILLLIGTGTGNFGQSAVRVVLPGPGSFGIGDIDLDSKGNVDLVIAAGSPNGTLQSLLNVTP